MSRTVGGEGDLEHALILVPASHAQGSYGPRRVLVRQELFDVRRAARCLIVTDDGQDAGGLKRGLEGAVAVEEHPVGIDILVDDVSFGRDLDGSVLAVPVGVAQGRDLPSVDIDDLRNPVVVDRNQDGGVLAAAGNSVT